MASNPFSGPVNSTNGFVGAISGTVTVPTYTVTTANALSPKSAGAIIYVSNGANGAAVVAFGNGSAWLRCDTLGALAAA